MISDTPKKVSVCMITYNHEKFISKALDSVLMQKTNFIYEIVIGEDCSTDNTRNILIDYKTKYPDRFQLLLNETNLGAYKNFNQTLQACKGEFIALLEGDDYWTSADKLQKQVEFFDRHPKCVICYHNVMINEDGTNEYFPYIGSGHKEISTINDLLIENFIPTASSMFRNGLLAEIPKWFLLLPMGDWPFHILIALHGNIGYIDEVMAVHVNHCCGAWAKMREDWIEGYKANTLLYDCLYTQLDAKYHSIVAKCFQDNCLHVANEYIKRGDIHKAKSFALMSFTKHHVVCAYLFKTLLNLYFPHLHKTLKFVKRAMPFAF